MNTRVLIIYTGGTIGMVHNPENGALVPFDFESLIDQVPEVHKLGVELDHISFEPIIDSSDMNPEYWAQIAETIYNNYEKYDGFVVLQGTDTMAYTASALSFMLQGLSKPVVLTGSQLPIGTIRTDGKENLITAIEIAAYQENGKSVVPEVCVYFENQLFRGNRTTKHNAEYFYAFRSDNYPSLAKVGINIHYDRNVIMNRSENSLPTIFTNMDSSLAMLRLFPGIKKDVVEQICNMSGIKALIIQTYGSGNTMTDKWFVDVLKETVDRGVFILNVTQCRAGGVKMGHYQSSVGLIEAGVWSGYDISLEAAITKMMYVLGKGLSRVEAEEIFKKSVCGEISVN